MPFDTVVAKTIEYLAIPSVVGHEKLFLKYLKNDFENLGLTVTRHQGVLEISGNAPQSVIISAHVDRHGLISLGGGKYSYAAEYIKEEKYQEDNQSSQKVLNAISDRFEDEIVYAYNPNTGDRLGEGVIRDCDPCIAAGNAVFFIEGMDDMPENTPIAYGRTAVSDGKVLKGQIDNVVSLGVIYTLFQNGFQGTALLSCEEEIGKSWIHIMNWLEQKNIETKELIILDTSPYRETAPVEGGVVVLRNRDKSESFNPILVEKIKQRCTDLLMPFQVKDEYFLSMGLEIKDLGSTELGRIVQNSNGRWSGATVQIPTTEYHTSYETTSREAIETFYAILQNILVTHPIIR
jgi:putative aminopeptidase FrvX